MGNLDHPAEWAGGIASVLVDGIPRGTHNHAQPEGSPALVFVQVLLEEVVPLR